MKKNNRIQPKAAPAPAMAATDTTAFTINTRTCWWIVAGLTLLAAVLRFWKLGFTSLWGDEICFVTGAHPESLAEYIRNYNIAYAGGGMYPPQLPLPTLVEHFVLKLGNSDFIARVPSAVFGTLTVPTVYLIGRRLFDRATGLIASALVCLSFFLIYYSREAVYYAAVVFFSTAFVAAFLHRLEDLVMDRSARLGGLFLLWMLGAFALISHLTAVFFFVALGAVLAAVAGWKLRMTTVGQRRNIFSRNILPLLIAYALCWVFVLPFLIYSLRIDMQQHEATMQIAFASLWKLPLQIGWGKIWPAAILYWLCLIVGIFGGLIRSRRRLGTTFCLWLIVFVAGAYLHFSRFQEFRPRYLTLIVVPSLLIAASGMSMLAEWVGRIVKSPAMAKAAPAMTLALLGLFEIRPLHLLYQLPGKPTNWRGIAQWMSQNLPPDHRLVFFDWYVNVWQHVPTYYAVPNVQCTAVIPVGSADHMIGQTPLRSGSEGIYRDITRATLGKYSDAAYLEAMRLYEHDPRFDALGGRKWQWPEKYYRSKKSFRNDAILELDRLGLCPIGINYATMGEVEPILYYNTRDDLISIHRERGDKLFRRFGEGLGHVQTQDLRHWRTLTEKATAELFNLTDKPIKAQLRLSAVALRYNDGTNPQRLLVRVEANGKELGKFEMPFQKLAQPTLAIELPPGRTDVQLIGLPLLREATPPDLLVDDVVLTLDE